MDNNPTDNIIIEHSQTLRFSTISNIPEGMQTLRVSNIPEGMQTLRVSNIPEGMQTLGMEDHTLIQKLISDRRAITNARNRLNYKIRSLQDRNHQIKSSSQLQPKGRKPKAITDQEIQIYILKQVKPVKAVKAMIQEHRMSH
jgi:hypothetical protein